MSGIPTAKVLVLAPDGAVLAETEVHGDDQLLALTAELIALGFAPTPANKAAGQSSLPTIAFIADVRLKILSRTP